ncbi:MAG: NAD-dependent epimerase/dehydratase family protein [Verrucomicrobiales bacterium]|nr:NAD-dependent epimerase/dehydratase family protein [Verrucomicrobiales bacterium]
MKVVITGGGGFLGSRLCRKLQEKKTLTGPSGEQEEIDEIVLFDVGFPASLNRVESETEQGSVTDPTLLGKDYGGIVLHNITGDMGDRDAVYSLIDRDDIAVFHLASMVSGECEQRFDDALRANLDGGRYLLEALREKEGTPRLVFASSVAAFGGEVMPDTVSDSTKRTPQTTYGMTKVIGELMINDYSRKGFLDGRSARLPTIIIRPGKPNAAASSWASGMFREPLNGETCYLPVHRDQLHPVLGYRDVIDSFVALHEADPSLLNDDRAFGLPSHRISVAEALTILEQVAAETGVDLGMVIDEPDPVIQGIVDTWPTATDGSRAVKIGVPEPKPVADIIRDYMADYLSPGLS